VYAPAAFIVDGRTCTALGRGTVFGLRGDWAVGYLGYLGASVAPDNYGPPDRFVAIRWRGEQLHELGWGVAFAVNREGFAVGESDPNGPQAIAWDQRGRRMDVVTNGVPSVAYDVSDDGTVVGMLQSKDGKHYAFRWRAGRLQRLDDLPHPPGWRFESAYAIGCDGTIAGIGTRDNIPTVFRWCDRPDTPRR